MCRYRQKRIQYSWAQEDEEHIGRLTIIIFLVWFGDHVGQEAILGINIMVPAGIRLNLEDGTLCLPD